jgi:hypothetical protein
LPALGMINSLPSNKWFSIDWNIKYFKTTFDGNLIFCLDLFFDDIIKK